MSDSLYKYEQETKHIDIDDLATEITRVKRVLNNMLDRHRGLCVARSFENLDKICEVKAFVIPTTINPEVSKVISISCAADIPNAPLYQLPSGDFAIKINDTLLQGSVANIVRSKGGSTKGLFPCKRGLMCRYLNTIDGCVYWHPPEERYSTTPEYNNLTPGSWTNSGKIAPSVNSYGVNTEKRQQQRLTMHTLLQYVYK